ncbi:uncharacterized protein LOC122512554 [Leptopilina heterotoma]|uniref:uncharacterized protein LOC122512554 n=1 Tax=Leptopilina heterotoma TaxID=63436 RepID=UPI001CA7EA86|nr:uncharacterized protein LOC122512554 [Leptopilina heterotoma]
MFSYITLHALNDIDEFTESLCWFLSAAVGCMKMTNFLLRRRDIVKLIELLNQDFLKTRDSTEEILQEKCDIIARILSFRRNIEILKSRVRRYNENRVYLSQSLSSYIGAFISVGSETFIMTMIIQICCQLDIIYHRLENLPLLSQNNEKSTILLDRKEAEIIKDCVLHHNSVYR